jgi:hypothetical protein
MRAAQWISDRFAVVRGKGMCTNRHGTADCPDMARLSARKQL